MAITVTDVKSPTGDVDGAVWFPSLSSGAVDTLLTGYIADAYTRVEADESEAAKLWVYYRAASAVADRLATSAASKTVSLVDQGSKSETFAAGQFAYWAAKAQGYLAAFDTLVADDTDDVTSGFTVLRSYRPRVA